MASCSLTLITNNGNTLRKYGGNRSDVKRMYEYYNSLKVGELSIVFPNEDVENLRKVIIIKKLNKR